MALIRNRHVVWTSCREPHLGSGHVRPRQQAGHMIASDPIRCCCHSCKPGAVHIWVSLTLDPTYGYDSIPRAGRPVGLAPGIDRPERLADPGALVLLRLAAARFHQAVGVLVPGAVGEIVPEHGGGGLRFLDDAERHV